MTNIYDDEQLMQSLLQTFHDEASDHLMTLNQSLLKLERATPDTNCDDLIQLAFRAAHSLKGAARAVGIEPIQLVAHSIEDVLKGVRDGAVSLTASDYDALYDGLDAVQGLLNDEAIEIDPILSRMQILFATESPVGLSSKSIDSPAMLQKEETATVTKSSNDSDETIRVALSKIDTIMAEVGELAISQRNSEYRKTQARSLQRQTDYLSRKWQTLWDSIRRINQGNAGHQQLLDMLKSYQDSLFLLLEDINDYTRVSQRDSTRLNMIMSHLQDDVRRIRMIPFRTQEAYLQRIVRDAAREESKQVNLIIEGQDVELDKKVLELLKDPLLHLLRNAVSHGIETQADRQKTDKPLEGQIRVSIRQRGNEAHITVADDGQGFQLELLRANLPKEEQIISDDELINHSFLPGVTTTHEVTSISGRGIGLDVVRQQIESLQGRIRVDTNESMGTTIELIVPVSLAMTRVLVARIGDLYYALPLASVEKIIRPDNIFFVEGRTMLRDEQQSYVLVSLGNILGHATHVKDNTIVVIVTAGNQSAALAIDDIVTEQEMAVKSFSAPIRYLRHLSGAALLGNGDPIGVLNVGAVIKSAHQMKSSEQFKQNTLVEDETDVVMEHILVVDDSITTRTLEKNILEAAGYTVTTAIDGVEALKTLKRQPIDLMVVDVEMPNMDGISLTKHLRKQDDYQYLPLILVTSLESPEDRERGMVAGANAYIVKRGFSQSELLDTIRQLL